MKTRSQFALAVLVVMAFSCKGPRENTENTVSTTDETATETSSKVATDSVSPDSQNPLSSKAAVETKRKFIRTADIRFQVKDVPKATYAIEDVVADAGGFIVDTNLKSNILESERTKISNDSIVQTTRYTVTNDLTLRVPNTRLNDVLRSISSQVGYLDYRVIKAEDVHLQLLSNQLEQDRLAKHGKRVENAIDKAPRKLSDIANSENALLDKQATSDNTKIQSLALADKVEYSTVVLQLYQNEAVKREMLANPDAVIARTGFGTKVADSLVGGWYIVEGIVVFILNLWPFIVFGTALFFGWRKFGRRKLTA